MTVGVAGLGLIGGSLAKAYKSAGHEVLGWNRSRSVLDFAMLSGDVDGELNEENVSRCDLVLVALYPEAAIAFIRRMAPYFGTRPVVIDCCGTKRTVCEACFPLSAEHGFTYIGGHPMAGSHNSGYKYARATLFRGAPMVLVPPVYDDIELLGRVKELLLPALFGSFSVTTAEKHDAMIAFTSQLTHMVSNAYVKSPTAASHKGFSAGSYKDMTRVAWLNPGMWAELFLENKENLLFELDCLSRSLAEYKEALEAGDKDRLVRLLAEGAKRKEEVDGR